MPSRSFGSNHVLLGGMTPPASAMAIKSSDARREHGKRAGEFAAVHQLFQFRRAADAADEMDALARARIVNAEHRREHVFLQQLHIEQFPGSSVDSSSNSAERERVPLAGKIKTEFMFAAGRRRAMTVNGKNGVENFQQLLRRLAVQILQHAVVGQNLHLVVRKNHGEKLSALARALARSEKPAPPPRCDDGRRRCKGSESARTAFR